VALTLHETATITWSFQEETAPTVGESETAQQHQHRAVTAHKIICNQASSTNTQENKPLASMCPINHNNESLTVGISHVGLSVTRAVLQADYYTLIY
jgi:hypothetical protein